MQKRGFLVNTWNIVLLALLCILALFSVVFRTYAADIRPTEDSHVSVFLPNGEKVHIIDGEMTSLDADAIEVRPIVGNTSSQNIFISEEAGKDYKISITNNNSLFLNFSDEVVNFKDGIVVQPLQLFARANNKNSIEVTEITQVSDAQQSTVTILDPGSTLELGTSETPAGTEPKKNEESWSFTIASWNLYNLSDKKVGLTDDPTTLKINLLENYRKILTEYDVVFVQEIINLTAFKSICDRLGTEYSCLSIPETSPGLGRIHLNNRKEFYGLVYRTDVFVEPPKVENTSDSNDDWERPPMKATITFLLPNRTEYHLDVYNIHTKPAYAAKDKNDKHRPKSASVSNELAAIEEITKESEDRIFITGDLNADCSSYPQVRRNQFSGDNWNWYINFGEKTNTAAKSSCAYDRFILNKKMNWQYLDHGIYTGSTDPDGPVINAMIDGKRVSDHYLIWMKVGAGAINTDEPTYPDRAPVHLEGSGFKANMQNTPVYVVKETPINDQALIDVTERIERLSSNANGDLDRTLVWGSASPTGIYSAVLDINDDGTYQQDVDVVTQFNVTNLTKRKFSIMVTSEDGAIQENQHVRKRQKSSQANNLFGHADSSSIQAEDAQVFVTSYDQMDTQYNINTWQSMNGRDLSPIAVDGYPITTSFDDDGVIFDLIWPNIQQSYTENTYDSYGDSLNLVIDVNNNHVFDAGVDLVDTSSITDILAWFASGNQTLGPDSGNNTIATQQYKVFLAKKLPPSFVDLIGLDVESNEYDQATKIASQTYLCSPILTSENLSLLKEAAEIGFRIILPEQNIQDYQLDSQFSRYNEVSFQNVKIEESSTSCFSGSNMALANVSFEKSSESTFQSSNSMDLYQKFTVEGGSNSTVISPQFTVNNGFTLFIPKPDNTQAPREVFQFKTWQKSEL